jgi:hypothetical protein
MGVKKFISFQTEGAKPQGIRGNGGVVGWIMNFCSDQGIVAATRNLDNGFDVRMDVLQKAIQAISTDKSYIEHKNALLEEEAQDASIACIKDALASQKINFDDITLIISACEAEQGMAEEAEAEEAEAEEAKAKEAKAKEANAKEAEAEEAKAQEAKAKEAEAKKVRTHLLKLFRQCQPQIAPIKDQAVIVAPPLVETRVYYLGSFHTVEQSRFGNSKKVSDNADFWERAARQPIDHKKIKEMNKGMTPSEVNNFAADMLHQTSSKADKEKLEFRSETVPVPELMRRLAGPLVKYTQFNKIPQRPITVVGGEARVLEQCRLETIRITVHRTTGDDGEPEDRVSDGNNTLNGVGCALDPVNVGMIPVDWNGVKVYPDEATLGRIITNSTADILYVEGPDDLVEQYVSSSKKSEKQALFSKNNTMRILDVFKASNIFGNPQCPWYFSLILLNITGLYGVQTFIMNSLAQVNDMADALFGDLSDIHSGVRDISTYEVDGTTYTMPPEGQAFLKIAAIVGSWAQAQKGQNKNYKVQLFVYHFGQILTNIVGKSGHVTDDYCDRTNKNLVEKMTDTNTETYIAVSLKRTHLIMKVMEKHFSANAISGWRWSTALCELLEGVQTELTSEIVADAWKIITVARSGCKKNTPEDIGKLFQVMNAHKWTSYHMPTGSFRDESYINTITEAGSVICQLLLDKAGFEAFYEWSRESMKRKAPEVTPA